MLQIYRIPTDYLSANCYIIESDAHERALVVDPGLGATRKVQATLERLGKRVGAVLLTHGHADHIWEAARVADLPGPDGSSSGAPIYLPGPDHYWLVDPVGQLQSAGLDALGVQWERPELVGEIPVGGWQILPGIALQMVPSPGHSPGSAIYVFADSAQMENQNIEAFALSGDVIFAGSVGRTDLPGGDEEEMRESLRTLAYALNPATVLLPGHGPETTWHRELDTNPYVQRAIREDRSKRVFD